MTKRPTINRTDVIAGSLLFLIGGAVFSASWFYDVGSLRRMGPGYFPMLLGGALCLIAVAVAWSGVFAPHERDALDKQAGDVGLWRPLVLVPTAILLFALLLQYAGLIPAVLVGVTVAGLADRTNNLVSILLIALATAVFTSVVFVKILGIPMRLLVL